MSSISIAPLTAAKTQDWMDQQLAIRGDAHVRRLATFWDDCQSGTRLILAAWHGEKLCGHITISWRSAYPRFAALNAPEIVDLWVQDDTRGKGVGQALLLAAEDFARSKGYASIGLCVGVTARFGAAQRLYIRNGYMPDGTGLWVNGENIRDDATVLLDETATLMLVKRL